MKKLLLVCLLLIVSATLASCTGSVATPTAAWAGIEVLNYAVEDINGKTLGEMTTTVRRKSTEGFSNILEGKEYSTSDCRMEMKLTTDKYEIDTTILAKGMNSLAIKKVFVDKQDNQNSYTLTGHHEGKRFVYSIDGSASKKLNVGAAGYSESEYLYMYLRCYGIDNVPASISIADTTNGTVTKVATSSKKQALSIDAVPYPDGAKSVLCNMVNISLSDSPIGKGITVYYTPDESAYNIDSFAQSATTTKKIPVLIVENDISYRLTGIFIA
jgi:hypothetical protein